MRPRCAASSSHRCHPAARWLRHRPRARSRSTAARSSCRKASTRSGGPLATWGLTLEKHEIVDPSQVEIVDDVGYERLVLTACHPLYSAAQRWAVFAKLTDVSAAGG